MRNAKIVGTQILETYWRQLFDMKMQFKGEAQKGLEILKREENHKKQLLDQEMLDEKQRQEELSNVQLSERRSWWVIDESFWSGGKSEWIRGAWNNRWRGWWRRGRPRGGQKMFKTDKQEFGEMMFLSFQQVADIWMVVEFLTNLQHQFDLKVPTGKIKTRNRQKNKKINNQIKLQTYAFNCGF